MLEVITDITTPSGAGKVNVAYFADDVPPQAAIDAMAQFWLEALLICTPSVTARVRANGRRLDPATGGLEEFTTGIASGLLVGAASGDVVADASQALVRWRTGVVRAGREVRGRTFIPGVGSTYLQGGNLNNTAIGLLNTAANNLVSGPEAFGVWSRPVEAGNDDDVPARPGIHVPATSGGAWSEFAVLRRRRS